MLYICISLEYAGSWKTPQNFGCYETVWNREKILEGNYKRVTSVTFLITIFTVSSCVVLALNRVESSCWEEMMMWQIATTDTLVASHQGWHFYQLSSPKLSLVLSFFMPKEWNLFYGLSHIFAFQLSMPDIRQLLWLP